MENERFCSHCYRLMEMTKPRPDGEIGGVFTFCAGKYENNLQKLIRAVKYHGQKELAYYQAKFMYDYWQKVPHQTYSYQVLPVPLYPTRERARGYNHMELVAKEFCKLTGYKLNTKVLKRIKNTKPQYKLSRKERLANLKGAFKVNEKKIMFEKIMILDDICTTGATFGSIIKEIMKSGINAEGMVCFATATPVEAKPEEESHDFDSVR